MAITREDVARLAGTSGTTVSFVLSGSWKRHKINEGTCKKVMAAVRELGYVPNRAAQELKLQRSGRVSLLLPGITRHFHGLVLEAFHQIATSSGYNLIVFFVEEDEQLDTFIPQAGSQSDGILLWGFSPSRAQIDRIERETVPIVRIRFMERKPFLRADSVTMDHEAAVQEAVNLLLARGYTNLFFTSIAAPRVHAIEKAMQQAGLPFLPERVISPKSNDFADGKTVAERVEILSDGTTGILADNDAVAIGCMSCLERRGIRAGRDYGLIGFDDLPVSAYLPVPMTTLRIPYEEIARAAFSMLARRQEDRGAEDETPQKIRLPFQLIERQSTERNVET